MRLTIDEQRYNFATAEQLENSPQFNFSLEFLYKLDQDKLDKLIKFLISKYVGDVQPKNFQRPKYNTTLRLVLINLIFACQSKHNGFLAIGMSKRYYTSIKHYNINSIKCDVTVKILKWLKKHELISIKKGYRALKESRLSRVMVCNKLNMAFRLYKLDNAIIVTSNSVETIKLKNKSKKLINYNDNTTTRKYRNNLKKINSLISSTKIELNGKVLPPQRLYRVFNDSSFSLGGRFYGGEFQLEKKNNRDKILINGKKTVELDYSAMHISMCYHINGLQAPKDCYSITGYAPIYRSVIKKTVIIMLNAKSVKQATHVILKTIKADRSIHKTGVNTKFIRQLIGDILKKHSLIKNMFFGAKAKDLQFKDSVIAEKILLYFSALGIPVLPVHDSFIVSIKHKDQLMRKMKQIYKNELSYNITVKQRYDI